MSGLTLDAGALIALERADRRLNAWLQEAIAEDLEIAVPAGALAQVFRDGSRQVRLVRLLLADNVSVPPLDAGLARRAGILCGARGAGDVVDASVVLCARARGHTVLTSDPHGLRKLDPALRILAV